MKLGIIGVSMKMYCQDLCKYVGCLLPEKHSQQLSCLYNNHSVREFVRFFFYQ